MTMFPSTAVYRADKIKAWAVWNLRGQQRFSVFDGPADQRALGERRNKPVRPSGWWQRRRPRADAHGLCVFGAVAPLNDLTGSDKTARPIGCPQCQHRSLALPIGNEGFMPILSDRDLQLGR
jgi:hypothetical protein